MKIALSRCADGLIGSVTGERSQSESVFLPEQKKLLLRSSFDEQTRTLVVLVQFLSHVQLFVTPWTAARQASLSFAISWSLLRLLSIESVMPSNHLVLCHPRLLPSVFPSIRVFSSESVLHIRWPKYWSFSISPSNEYSGFLSFRFDWLDLLAVQGTLKSLNTAVPSINSWMLSQLSHPHMTNGKTKICHCFHHFPVYLS